MVWVKTNPATGIKAKVLDDQIRTNNDALETAIDQDHDFTTGGTQTGVHDQVTMPEITEPTGKAAHITLWNLAGIPEWKDDLAGTVRKFSSDGDVIPAGTKMWFYANSAPTGWVIDSSVTDALIALKGGTAYATGGAPGVGDTWTQPSHTHTTPNHTLTTGEMPAHTHSQQGEFLVRANGANFGVRTQSGSYSTGSTGGGGAHNHGATGSSATANTWRPVAAVGLLATKSAY